MSNGISSPAEQVREGARQADGKFGSYSAGESGASLTAAGTGDSVDLPRYGQEISEANRQRTTQMLRERLPEKSGISCYTARNMTTWKTYTAGCESGYTVNGHHDTRSFTVSRDDADDRLGNFETFEEAVDAVADDVDAQFSSRPDVASGASTLEGKPVERFQAKPVYPSQHTAYNDTMAVIDNISRSVAARQDTTDTRIHGDESDGVVGVSTTHRDDESRKRGADLEVRTDWPDRDGGPHIKATLTSTDGEYEEARIPLSHGWQLRTEELVDSFLGPEGRRW